jgi:hypothetical protein
MAPGERDPERPDPAEPSRQRIRETLVERQIRAAMDEGAFDDLPHQGRRLPLEEDALAGEWAMAHRVLKNAGVAPPWIEADKAARDRLAALEALLRRTPTMSPLARARARSEIVTIVESANRAIARLNAEAPTDRQHRRPLHVAGELERFDRAAREEQRPSS